MTKYLELLKIKVIHKSELFELLTMLDSTNALGYEPNSEGLAVELADI